MTMQGTRLPKPIGPRMPPDPFTLLMSTLLGIHSPGVPIGAVGGTTWSKNEPHSSYIRSSAVFSHTAGLDSNIRRRSTIITAPDATGNAGCSELTVPGTTQETLGSLFVMTS